MGCGIVLAEVWVGQRDTKWLIPLTVSVVTRVRKVTTNYRRYSTPTTVAPFIFRYKKPDQISSGFHVDDFVDLPSTVSLFE
jgi:hypothetical protein